MESSLLVQSLRLVFFLARHFDLLDALLLDQFVLLHLLLETVACGGIHSFLDTLTVAFFFSL